jgi:carbonic anhydrase
MKAVFRAALALILLSSLSLAQHFDGADVWNELIFGNLRFAKNKSENPHKSPEYRTSLATGQRPKAIIIGCSDSRIPPEIIFDEGLGDLFVIRLAGNIISDEALGSIEYGAEHLHIPLIVVLGHESCGAVTAASKGYNGKDHIKILTDAIKPAIEKAREKKGPLVENAIVENVKIVVDKLKHSGPILNELYEEGKIYIVGARYDLDTGLIEQVE